MMITTDFPPIADLATEYYYPKDKEIGYVTTGYMIPNTKDSYAVALIDRDEYKLDKEVEILVRKKFVKAKIIKKKFMDKKYQK